MTLPIELPINPLIGRGVSTSHKSSNRIELFQLGQDLFNFNDLTKPHQSTHPSTQPYVGVSPQIINLQTELNYPD